MNQEILSIPRRQTEARSEFSALERLMVQHAEPVKLLSHTLAAMWALYFTFTHQWQTAAVVLIAGGVFGTYFARHGNPKELMKTALGKWFFVMVNPINLSVQLAGYALVFWGTWAHDIVFVLAGVSAILAGNFFGWDRLSRSRTSV